MRPPAVHHLVAILAIAAASQAPAHAADTGAIEGSVLDVPSGQAVSSGVTISAICGSLNRSTAVDATGQFRFAALPAGSCTLRATGAAYVTSTIAVTVSPGTIATVLINVSTRAYVDKLRADEAQLRKRMIQRRPVAVDMKAGGGAMAEFDAPQAAPQAARPMPAADPAAVMPRPATPARDAVPGKLARREPPAQPVGRGPVAPAAVRVVLDDRELARPVRGDEARANRGAGLRARGRAQLAEERVAQQVNTWAPVRVFPVPQYTRAYDGPRSDFRETVYWNPTVETDAAGTAEVAFVTSDAITAFRATAEGFSSAGAAGAGQVTLQSKLPLTLDARLPVEATAGDTIRLPVTISNETDEPLEARLTARFGAAFKLTGNPAAGAIRVPARQKVSLMFPLDVVATEGTSDGSADIALKLTARGLSDELDKTIRIVPRGFPIEVAASGTARSGAAMRHELDLAGALPGTIRASVTMYPSPIAAMTKGMDGMIREPGGCFEQTSSTNYPNIMILGYLGASDAADPALVQKTQGVLDRGYKLLTGYETKDRGYEWFGHTPGHEALTAYGLMEFADMAKVYDVDRKMMERTADWLLSRRDNQGGFQRSSQALDSFGRASPATTNAYIMWALAEAGRAQPLTRELAVQRALGAETKDPYLLALAANTATLTAPDSSETRAMVKRLAGMQAKDGSFPGARETITMSGGESLAVEATALATLALIKASARPSANASPAGEYDAQIRAGADWLNSKRGGWGAWSNTQATILGLKALTAYTSHARQMAAPGSATLIVNGKDAGTIQFDKGRRDALVWNDLAGKLVAGRNTVELRLASQATLPYTIAIEYRSAQPASAPDTKVSVTTQLLKTRAKMGEPITLRARVENTTGAGIPMTLARVGLPGGTVFQTWQLKELRDKGLIDFYETRPREVILYWRALPPSASKDVDIHLLAAVPGSYEAPASSAYLYYTAEDKAWTPPVAITIDN